METGAETVEYLYDPLNARNFRENLSRHTNQRPGPGYEAHHVFPQKFKKEFAEMGIDVHNPKYGAWWEKSAHRSTAYEYNNRWIDFL